MSISTRRPGTGFRCAACGELAPKWEGRCPSCNEWNSLAEQPEVARARVRSAPTEPTVRTLAAVEDGEAVRRRVGLGEFDRVLGGGIVDGGLILLGGDPGIGKSTLALQLAHAAGSAQRPALYCAGEESPSQLAMRASRLGCRDSRIAVAAETDVGACIAAIEARRPPLAVVDSVQTLEDDDVAGHAGSPSQVREAAVRLTACAKATGVPIILIGHVTKDGAIAGPRTLEHAVDVVLHLEGERHGEHRLLRGLKNRFGPAGELGLFRMTESGMVAVDAAGRSLLDEVSLSVPGNLLTVTCEGSRALVVEIQALTAVTRFGLPRRTCSGFDIGRLHLLLAVLGKRGRISCSEADVYLNCVGGVRLADPAVDLAVLLAVAGAARDRRIDADVVVLGEVGLGGEVRRVRRLEARLAEAAAVGLRHAIIPAGHESDLPPNLSYHRVGHVAEALPYLRVGDEGHLTDRVVPAWPGGAGEP